MVKRVARAVKWQAEVARNYPRWRKGVPLARLDAAKIAYTIPLSDIALSEHSAMAKIPHRDAIFHDDNIGDLLAHSLEASHELRGISSR